MAENVFEILRRDYPTLIIKLDENHDVCTFLHGMYAHLLNEAQSTNRNPKDMRPAATIVHDRILKITLAYTSSDESTADIGDKLPRQRNLNLVKFLGVNKFVKDLAVDITYLLERWVSDPAYQFSGKYQFKDIVMVNSMLWTGDPKEITSELTIKVQFDNMVNEMMGWETDNPEEDKKEKIQ